MAFHIDITLVRAVLLDGTPAEAFDHTETDYSLNDCVERGWYDPASDTWTRKTITVDEPYWFDDDGALLEEVADESGALSRPDPGHGQKLGLNPIRKGGVWMHKVSDDISLA